MEAVAIAQSVDHAGGLASADSAYLEQMRSIYNLVSVSTVDSGGNVIDTAGEPQPFAKHFTQVLSGRKENMYINASSAHAAAGARCGEGMIQVVVDKKNLAAALNLSGLNEALSFFHVGSEGSFDIIRNNSTITYGAHQDASLALDELAVLQRQRPDTFFTAKLFGKESLCLTQELDKGVVLLTQLPVTEVYANRDAQAYENGFADILLFAVIYVLISLLVQSIVVHNLQLVNLSLARITSGHLDEVVNVRDSSEFASLSNDINQTVSVLKGYIAAAEKRIEQELEFARTIQDSALPKNFNFPRKDF
jgi:methyl-accepting chemotaxis protein